MPLGPVTRDCRATLAGMSAQGRDGMVACMKTHCADKGLVGCEAMASAGYKRPKKSARRWVPEIY